MKAELKVLAWIHIVLGGLGLLLCLTVLSWLGRNPDHAHSQLLHAAGPVVGLAILIWFGPMLAGGYLILRGRPLGRLLVWAESALLLGLFPVGTALAGFGIWALMRSANQLSFQPVPRGFGKAVLIVLAAMSILGAIVGTGYLFREQIETAPDIVLKAGAVVVGLGLTWLIIRVVDGRGGARIDRSRFD